MAESNFLKSAFPWLALAAGVGGVAYGVHHAGASTSSPQREKDAGSASKKTKVKPQKKSATKRAPGPYALFVKAEMPSLMAKGYTTSQAMIEIGRRWKSQKS